MREWTYLGSLSAVGQGVDLLGEEGLGLLTSEVEAGGLHLDEVLASEERLDGRAWNGGVSGISH